MLGCSSRKGQKQPSVGSALQVGQAMRASHAIGAETQKPLAVVVIGLRIVGLILIVALLVIPPAAARFWTNHAGPMTIIAAAFGAASAYLGAALSAVHPHMPTGAVIVLVTANEGTVGSSS